jgi:hypothetical protein
MDASSLNSQLNDHISTNFSPKPEDRIYISGKYEAIKAVVGSNVFQSGSYGRFTAIYPVHDLDVIYVCSDPLLQNDPLRFMQELKTKLSAAHIDGVKSINVQTHSVTIEFNDAATPFGIDIVPALQLGERNNYNEPLYLVPEILMVNHQKRQQRYINAAAKPIDWVKSDPRGYIHAASDLNNANLNFRHAVKLVKAWRHAAKKMHKDLFKLKSFHLELIVTNYFLFHPLATTAEAVVESLGELGSSLTTPSIRDRADRLSFVDGYVAELTQVERQLIYSLQAKAHNAAGEILAAEDSQELRSAISSLTDVSNDQIAAPVSSAAARPQQPWAN